MAPSIGQLNGIMVAAVVAPTVMSGLIAYGVATVSRIKGSAIALICGLIAPLSVVVFAWLTPLTKADPRSIDGPAYALIGLIVWAAILVPTCLIASTVGTWLRRRSLTGRRS